MLFSMKNKTRTRKKSILITDDSTSENNFLRTYG